VGRVSPVPAQMWAGVGPVPAQMWAGRTTAREDPFVRRRAQRHPTRPDGVQLRCTHAHAHAHNHTHTHTHAHAHAHTHAHTHTHAHAHAHAHTRTGTHTHTHTHTSRHTHTHTHTRTRTRTHTHTQRHRMSTVTRGAGCSGTQPFLHRYGYTDGCGYRYPPWRIGRGMRTVLSSSGNMSLARKASTCSHSH
jgi:hypothetical protein